jgi:pimeloyl-ACP methyl ester carboxylesterase
MPQLSLLLVHSPLVGPSSWRPLDETARDRGFDVLRPDLTGVADAAAPQWQLMVDIAEQSAKGCGEIIVVGHSGAGAMLPAIAERIGDRLRAVIFVDAVVPPPEGAHTTSPGLQELLDAKAVDGLLPRWLDWWPSHINDELIPDPEDQDELRADMPRLPRAFFDDAVPVPSGWSAGPCAYLKLSAAYDQEYDDAGTAGWARSASAGTHLSIFTDPVTVLDAIEDLVIQVGDK